MKKILFTLIALICILSAKAQKTDTVRSNKGDDKIYTEVDVNPEFPGGLTAFDSYVDINSVKILKADRTSGLVIASVLIETNGRVTRPIIVKSLTPATDSAAIYLLHNSPLWTPAKKNGVLVRTGIGIVVRFNGAQYNHKTDIANGKITKPKYADITIDEPIPATTPIIDSNKIFSTFETPPSFVGGDPQFNVYIKQNLKWPPNSKKNKGRVLLNFIVEKDGTLTNIKIIARALASSPEMDAEAIRLLKNSPKWKPGTWGGRPVRIAYTIPITFEAEN